MTSKKFIIFIITLLLVSVTGNLSAQSDTRMMPGIYRSQSTSRIVLINGMNNPYQVIVTDNSRTIYDKGRAIVDDYDVYVNFEKSSSAEWFLNPLNRLEFLTLIKSDKIPDAATDILPVDIVFVHSGVLAGFADILNSFPEDPVSVTLINIPDRYIGKNVGIGFVQEGEMVSQDLESKFAGGNSILDKSSKTFTMIDNTVSTAADIDGFYLYSADRYLVGFLVFDSVTTKTAEAWTGYVNIRTGNNVIDFGILSKD